MTEGMLKVTTTNQPDETKEVTEAEAKSLFKLGILKTLEGNDTPNKFTERRKVAETGAEVHPALVGVEVTGEGEAPEVEGEIHEAEVVEHATVESPETASEVIRRRKKPASARAEDTNDTKEA